MNCLLFHKKFKKVILILFLSLNIMKIVSLDIFRGIFAMCEIFHLITVSLNAYSTIYLNIFLWIFMTLLFSVRKF